MKKLWAGIGAALFVAAVTGGTWVVALDSYLSDLHERGQRTQDLTVTALDSELQRFRVMPRLLSDTGIFQALTLTPNPERVAAANELLERVNAVSGALDTYVLDSEGLTLAASNWSESYSFVGKNYAYRPYFYEAMEGRLGVFFALGIASNKRGIYFGSAIRAGRVPIGVVVVKVDVEAIERTWEDSPNVNYLADANGVIFMANKPGLRLRSLGPLSPEARERIAKTRQFSDQKVEELPLLEEQSFGNWTLLRPKDDAWLYFGFRAQEFLKISRDLPSLELQANILVDTTEARESARLAAGVAGLIALVATLLLAIVYVRRKSLLDRRAYEARALAELEQRVVERTQALTQANSQLVGEVAERKAAEAALRQAQDELVQANKLKALGQLSAGISHELNQPLSAIGSYAENARIFLDRDRPSEAQDNLGKIADLTQRMARIIKNLRSFARKEGEPAVEVAFDAIVEQALQLLEKPLEEGAVEVIWQRPLQPVFVFGGEVRLQQVLVNILTNALDAMEGQDHKKIEISLGAEPDQGVVEIRDNGPGLTRETEEKLFDPFYSTKAMDKGPGLGLGLSISYGIVQSFNGTIRGFNHPDGGTVFRISIPQKARRAA
ncbi:ATP-binding protein [Rhodovibrionaceae bacterium A322]